MPADINSVVPYDCSKLEDLSNGASRAQVYRLSNNAVIKLPFQFPPGGESYTDKIDRYQSSIRSIKHFSTERAFYLQIVATPHTNIICLLCTSLLRCLVLEYVSPMAEVWENFDDHHHIGWVAQLMNAVTFLESRGILYGDLAVRNMGVGEGQKLKLFDFGSVVRETDEDYCSQLLDDHFDIATCIHFLLSGIHPLDYVKRQDLERGVFKVSKKANSFKFILYDCWGRTDISTFSVLQNRMLGVLGSLEVHNIIQENWSQIDVNLKMNEKWMGYEEFRSQWITHLDLEVMDDDLIA